MRMFSRYLFTSVFTVLGALGVANATTCANDKTTTTTEHINFRDNPNAFDFGTEAPKVDTWFGKKNAAGVEVISPLPHQMTLDTGSTGIMISQAHLADWDISEATTENEGYQYLSSSKFLYRGHWVERYVYFNHDDPSHEIKSKVPILVVDEKILCDDYVIGDGRECTTGTAVSNPLITWMGIGFGRTYDGQEESTPDKNPFLNVESIGGLPVDEKFYPGWIMTKQGVDIGLTKENWNYPGGPAKNAVQLPPPPPPRTPPPRPPPPPPPSHLYQWGELPGCVQVNSIPAPCQECSVLLDTGVEQSYMTLPGDPEHSSTWPFHWPSHKKNEGIWPAPYSGMTDASSAPGNGASLLNPGAVVDVGLGHPGRMATFGYTSWNFMDRLAPIWTNIPHTLTRDFAFVNTGRHVFRKYIVAFDPVCGKVGFVRHPTV
jgi:hypothetical protein